MLAASVIAVTMIRGTKDELLPSQDGPVPMHAG